MKSRLRGIFFRVTIPAGRPRSRRSAKCHRKGFSCSMFTKEPASLVQIYVGDGKGKTTAAIGQTVRATGHGMRVCFAQFLKNTDEDIGERKSLSKLNRNVSIMVHDYPPALYADFRVADKSRLRREVTKFFEAIEMVICGGQFDMIVLDELGAVLELGLLDEEKVLHVLASRPETLDVVITGHKFSNRMLDMAHLITEFKKKRHPFDFGAQARKGIEF